MAAAVRWCICISVGLVPLYYHTPGHAFACVADSRQSKVMGIHRGDKHAGSRTDSLFKFRRITRSPYPSDTYSLAVLILEARRRVLSQPERWKWMRWHTSLRFLLVRLHVLMFPPHIRTRRHYTPLDVLLVTRTALNGIMHFARFPTSPRNRLVWEFLDPKEFNAWLPQREGPIPRDALNLTFRRLRTTLFGEKWVSKQPGNSLHPPSTQNSISCRRLGNVYSTNTSGMEYAGYFADLRARDLYPGAIARGLEHIVFRHQKHLPGALKKRYRKARRTSPADYSFTPSRRELQALAQAIETLSIRGNNPRENERKPGYKPPSGTGARRRRPPRWIRQAVRRVRSRRTHDHAVAPTAPTQRALKVTTSLIHSDQGIRWLTHRCKALVTSTDPHVKLREWRSEHESHTLFGPVYLFRSALHKARWSQTYAEAYRAYRRKVWETRGLTGPIDVYSPCHRQLLVQYASSTTARIQWSLLDRRWTLEQSCLKVWDYARYLLLPGRRKNVRDKTLRVFAKRDLPYPRRLRFVVDTSVPPNAVKGGLKSVLAPALNDEDETAQWVFRNVWLCHVGQKKLSRLRTNKQAALQLCLEEVQSMTPEACTAVLHGHNFVRLAGTSNIPVISSQGQYVKAFHQRLCSFGDSLRITPTVAPPDLVNSVTHSHWGRSLVRARNTPPAYLGLHRTFQATFLCPDPTWVITAEDKPPSESWLVPRAAYQWWALECMTRSGWTLASITPECAEAHVRRRLTKALPKRFRYLKRRINQPHVRCVPVIYVNLKLKCFCGSGLNLHSCVQGGHQCCRKIISFYELPTRSVCKLWHRASETALRPIPSWQCWGLDELPRLIRTRSRRLKSLPNFKKRCICCGGKKSSHEQGSMDAGQAYEQLEPDRVKWILIALFALSRSHTGKNTVTVTRTQRRVAHLGGETIHATLNGKPSLLRTR